jgi:hypothetical protein
MVRHLLRALGQPGEAEQERARGLERRAPAGTQAVQEALLVPASLPREAQQQLALRAASVSRSGPTRPIARAVAARISSSETLRGRGDILTAPA